MKRITKIEIENFRAFYDSYNINLLEGENLLIYGENGSGKSSLFKAMNLHLASSRIPTLSFIKNNYRPLTDDGFIKLTFTDINPVDGKIMHGTDQSLEFGSATRTNAIGFVQDAELTKGFLDYRILLAVYNHSEPNPNLFSLIVFELLKNFIPVGATFSLGDRFQELTEEIKNAYTRETWVYRLAVPNLVAYEATLRDTLDRVFIQLNYFLIKYFKINLRVWYDLASFNAPSYNWRYIPKDLRLRIKHNGTLVLHQSDYLNEARLSALSVCLYLAAQKQIPQNIDYKILFLDDVFIGLDSGNRIPIAKILNEEFEEYQIFITTYDRSWFELAQRFFKSQTDKKWTSVELYSSTQNVAGKNFEIPILIPYEDNFDRASFYLHHRTKPDYPAAANFFRKCFEEILKSHLPEHEIRDENYALIETYRLGTLVKVGLKFLHKINADLSLLLELQNALPTLLHPLSHYELSTQVYKAELLRVEELLPKLETQLTKLKLEYKVFIPQGRMVKLNFIINPTDIGYYEIYTKETIYILRSATTGILSLSLGECHTKCSYITSNGIEIMRKNFSVNDFFAQYTSISDSFDKIYNFIITQPAFSHILQAPDPLTEYHYYDRGLSHTLHQHMNQIIW